jgi:DHA3 family macrolide efflux protein-like MFS transporter
MIGLLIAATPSLTIREVLAIPGMGRLWTAQFVSVMGDFLALFAILSVASFRLHGTPEQLTLISLFYMLPMAVIGPVAGVFVDRWNVKTTMISSDLIRCVLAFGLIFAHSLTALYVLLFAISFVSTFFSPAQSVTVRTIVPPEGLLNANALIMQAFLVTRIVSPALAGALVSAFGPNVCFFYDGVSFLFSAAMLSGISIDRVAVQAGKGIQAVFQDLRSGMAFLFHSPVLSFVILAMGAGMFVMSCFGPLIAIYVRDFLSAGSATFGFLSALIGVGMLVGTVGLRRFGMKIPSEHMVLIGLVLIGLSVLLMAAFRLVSMTAVSTFGLGFGVAFIITPAQVLMQGKTPPQLLGRVSSSFMSVIAIAQMLGLVISGGAASWIGIRGLFFSCAVLLGVLAVAGYWRMPRSVQS